MGGRFRCAHVFYARSQRDTTNLIDGYVRQNWLSSDRSHLLHIHRKGRNLGWVIKPLGWTTARRKRHDVGTGNLLVPVLLRGELRFDRWLRCRRLGGGSFRRSLIRSGPCRPIGHSGTKANHSECGQGKKLGIAVHIAYRRLGESRVRHPLHYSSKTILMLRFIDAC